MCRRTEQQKPQRREREDGRVPRTVVYALRVSNRKVLSQQLYSATVLVDSVKCSTPFHFALRYFVWARRKGPVSQARSGSSRRGAQKRRMLRRTEQSDPFPRAMSHSQERDVSQTELAG
ncbi:hypothetical protein MTO96_048576 [Rhipicephalus appendiculatus]